MPRGKDNSTSLGESPGQTHTLLGPLRRQFMIFSGIRAWPLAPPSILLCAVPPSTTFPHLSLGVISPQVSPLLRCHLSSGALRCDGLCLSGPPVSSHSCPPLIHSPGTQSDLSHICSEPILPDTPTLACERPIPSPSPHSFSSTHSFNYNFHDPGLSRRSRVLLRGLICMPRPLCRGVATHALPSEKHYLDHNVEILEQAAWGLPLDLLSEPI